MKIVGFVYLAWLFVLQHWLSIYNPPQNHSAMITVKMVVIFI